jgi:hypothetical protein
MKEDVEKKCLGEEIGLRRKERRGNHNEPGENTDRDTAGT